METSTNNLSTMTPISRDALHLHNDFMLVITMLFIVVFGIMIYTMVKHRRSAGYQPTKFTGPTGTVQWLWAMVPFAILLFIDYAPVSYTHLDVYKRQDHGHMLSFLSDLPILQLTIHTPSGAWPCFSSGPSARSRRTAGWQTAPLPTATAPSRSAP